MGRISLDRFEDHCDVAELSDGSDSNNDWGFEDVVNLEEVFSLRESMRSRATFVTDEKGGRAFRSSAGDRKRYRR